MSRRGTQLVLNGRPYRFAGTNIPWLGLVGEPYGSDPPAAAASTARFPSRFEVDDAFATVRAMGGTVVRSFTLGVSVGCPNCLEPAPGRFNARAFRAVDYALESAREHGVRLIVPLVDGDAFPNTLWYFGNIATYAAWRNAPGSADFYTDPRIRRDYERHIDAVLNRVNSYTGVPYKDDPTILAWETCNECGAGPHPPGAFPSASWTSDIATHIKHTDRHHLVLDGDIHTADRDPASWTIQAIDASDRHFYARWGAPVATELAAAVNTVTSHGQAFIAAEFGWDPSNFATPDDLRQWLDRFRDDPRISGDAFWALQAHAVGGGWMPVPDDPPVHAAGGEWWAFYYGGNRTSQNTVADMRVRGQVLRTHAYAMRGIAEPPPAAPPPPRVAADAPGTLTWSGAAGAYAYTVERSDDGGRRWRVACNGCATDLLSAWADPVTTTRMSCYRIRAVNAAARTGPPSRTVCPKSA